MLSISPSDGLALWFTNLRQFQAACNNTSVSKMDLLTFANSTIVTALPSATEQNTFLTSAGISTGYDDIATADLTTYKTFEGLLDNWNPLPTAVAVLLQFLAVPSSRSGECGFHESNCSRRLSGRQRWFGLNRRSSFSQVQHSRNLLYYQFSRTRSMPPSTRQLAK